MAIKTHKIHSMQELGKVITDENAQDILSCLTLGVLHFIEQKKAVPELKFIGINWKDDKQNKLTGFNVQFEKPKKKKK